jgi:hypothetical protein
MHHVHQPGFQQEASLLANSSRDPFPGIRSEPTKGAQYAQTLHCSARFLSFYVTYDLSSEKL